MKKGKDYGLLIASMVAIVAIVGLVIMFSEDVTGEYKFPMKTEACYYTEDGMICDGESVVPDAGFEGSGVEGPKRLTTPEGTLMS